MLARTTLFGVVVAFLAGFLAASQVQAAVTSAGEARVHIYTRGGGASGASVAVPSAEAAANLMRLRAKAAAGRLRVMVGLDFPMVNEDALNPAAATRQAQSLAAAQRSMLSRVVGHEVQRHRVRTYESIPFVAATVNAEELERLLDDPAVYWIGEVGTLRPLASKWNIAKIEVEKVWSAGYDGTGFAIAVLDTGMQTNHPMLSGTVVEEMCFSTEDGANSHTLCPNGRERQTGPGAAKYCPLTLEFCDHGTHVASIAAGSSWNGLQGVGRGANLILGQVFSKIVDAHGTHIGGYDDDTIGALQRVYNLRNKYKIAAVNLSLGGGAFSAPCDDSHPDYAAIVLLLREAKIATLAASGNERLHGSINSPACLTPAIAVGATTSDDQVADLSNHSDLVRLMAPGIGIDGAVPVNGHDVFNGTSMATPHVAGAFAVLRSFQPSANVDKILRALACTGQTVVEGGIFKRRINVKEAYQVLQAPENRQQVFNFDTVQDAASWKTVIGEWKVSDGQFKPTFQVEKKADVAVTRNCNVDGDITMKLAYEANGYHQYRFEIRPRGLYTVSGGCSRFSGYGIIAATTGDFSDRTFDDLTITIARYDQYSPTCKPNAWRILKQTSTSLDASHFANLKVVLRGATIAAYVDGVKVLSAKDTTYTTGSISIYAWSRYPDDKAGVDQFTITPRDAATTAPRAFVYGGASDRNAAVAAR